MTNDPTKARSPSPHPRHRQIHTPGKPEASDTPGKRSPCPAGKRRHAFHRGADEKAGRTTCTPAAVRKNCISSWLRFQVVQENRTLPTGFAQKKVSGTLQPNKCWSFLS